MNGSWAVNKIRWRTRVIGERIHIPLVQACPTSKSTFYHCFMILMREQYLWWPLDSGMLMNQEPSYLDCYWSGLTEKLAKFPCTSQDNRNSLKTEKKREPSGLCFGSFCLGMGKGETKVAFGISSSFQFSWKLKLVSIFLNIEIDGH